MDSIFFATGNSGKLATLRKHFTNAGVNITVEQSLVDMVEPQAETATEVARSKARQAYEVLQAPVLVDDSSFHITALGGFPGPYIKYMLSTIGIAGILEFMSHHDDRSAYFLSTLVYIDASGTEHVFEDEPYWGTIGDSIVKVENEESWSDLSKVFISKGSNKTLAELGEAERAALKNTGDSYAAFTQWIVQNNR